MKIAITGHTSGIGKSLLHEFQSRGHEVMGFSRSNGYDIANEKIQERILNEISTVDIFINNAHKRFCQVEIFSRVWKSWRNEPKKIINIGSIITESRTGHDPNPLGLGKSHYAAEKAGLEMACSWAWNDQESKCDVVLIRPGLVDTPRTQNVQVGSLKIDPDSMAKYIVHSVMDYPFAVREIMIGNYRKNNA